MSITSFQDALSVLGLDTKPKHLLNEVEKGILEDLCSIESKTRRSTLSSKSRAMIYKSAGMQQAPAPRSEFYIEPSVFKSGPVDRFYCGPPSAADPFARGSGRGYSHGMVARSSVGLGAETPERRAMNQRHRTYSSREVARWSVGL